MKRSTTPTPTRQRHLCGHLITPEPDCLQTRSLAQLRTEPCKRCQLIECAGDGNDLVLGHLDGDRFVEDMQRTLSDDGRVAWLSLASETTCRFCVPKRYPHSIAQRRVVDGVGIQYEVIYRSR